jgi:hypothetical protein
MKLISALYLVLLAALPLAGQSSANWRTPVLSPEVSKASPHVEKSVLETYGKLPLAFEANQGQTDPQVKFVSRGAGYNLFLTRTEAVLTLHKASRQESKSLTARSLPPHSDQSAVLHMKLMGASAKAEVFGQDELPGKSNYFVGNDPTKWHANVRQYARVRYADVYPGVALVYYGNQREMEYDFELKPGADPSVIRLGIEGAEKFQLENGDLVLRSPGGEVHLRRPHIYQQANGTSHDIGGRYVVKNKNEVRFRVASYDRGQKMIIDPVLSYSSYLGGNSIDIGNDIAVDVAGNAYVTGYTFSTDFPTVNAIQPIKRASDDVFVTKMNADGSALIYSTYLGGSDGEEAHGIAVDGEGNAYVAGATWSSDFPVVNAIQSVYKGAHSYSDAFVTKINADGSALVYSTYLGGSGGEVASVAVDSGGNAYITGSTDSTDFPTANAIQPTKHGYSDGFVTKINADGRALVYSTYLGGSGFDLCSKAAVDSGGNAYISGETNSTDFPTVNAIQPTNHGTWDAFVTKMNADGSALVYSTYLGGSGQDSGSIAVDEAGNAYVAGSTDSTDFPTANAIQPNKRGSTDVFVSKINADGSALVYSTYLGGSSDNYAGGIAVDVAGNAYVTGYTASTDFPTANAIQRTKRGLTDLFVTKINADGSALAYSTYLGGRGRSSYEVGNGIAVDAAGSAFVTGYTSSVDFPKTALAFQQLLNGPQDGVVAKIASQTLVKVSTLKVGFARQTIGTTSVPKKPTLTNKGASVLTINKIYIAGPNAGDFVETNNCGIALAPGSICTIWVTFTPTAKDTRQGVLAISDSDPASPQAIALTGPGTVVRLSPTKLSFGNQPIGMTSEPKDIALTNVGSTPLNFTGISLTGSNASDFSQINNCGTSIAGGASCTITVTFKPTAKGSRTAAVNISDDGGGSPQKVGLTGTGT